MDNDTSGPIDPIRRALIERQKRLVDIVRGANLSSLLGDPRSGAVTDLKEVAAFGEQNERDVARERLALEELEQVNAAIARIRQQTFGRCESCGQAIGHRRLSAQPTARRCLSCQASLEGEAPRR